jgi:hypothetical protein
MELGGQGISPQSDSAFMPSWISSELHSLNTEVFRGQQGISPLELGGQGISPQSDTAFMPSWISSEKYSLNNIGGLIIHPAR